MRCILCGSRSHILPESRKLYKCHSCGLVFVKRTLIPNAETCRERYLKHDNSFEHSGYRSFLNSFLKKSVLPFSGSLEGLKTLDMGCGPAPVLAEILSRRGAESYKFDPLFFPEEEILGKSYDLITLTEVVEHVRNPADLMRTLSRMLQPGGIISAATLFYREGCDFTEWWYASDITHINFFSEKTVDAASRYAGLNRIFSDGERMFTLKKVTS